MKRVINPRRYLVGAVEPKTNFYIGFGTKNLSELGKHHNGLNDLIEGNRTTLLVTGRRGSLKENTKGKWVRKQPERKESIWKHIHYYSSRFEKDIDYDRQFHIWEKEILHKYNLELEAAKTPQEEIILHFPVMNMEDTEALMLKAGAAMNMSIALGSYFMIYDSHFEPIVPVTKIETRRILAPGSGTSIQDKLEAIERDYLNGNGDANEGNSYRFAMLKKMNPTDVTMGLGGFNEYLMFEFAEDNLAIFENLRTGNATYIFRLSEFSTSAELNKQNAVKNSAFLKRVIHNNLEDWKKQFTAFFKR